MGNILKRLGFINLKKTGRDVTEVTKGSESDEIEINPKAKS